MCMGVRCAEPSRRCWERPPVVFIIGRREPLPWGRPCAPGPEGSCRWRPPVALTPGERVARSRGSGGRCREQLVRAGDAHQCSAGPLTTRERWCGRGVRWRGPAGPPTGADALRARRSVQRGCPWEGAPLPLLRAGASGAPARRRHRMSVTQRCRKRALCAAPGVGPPVCAGAMARPQQQGAAARCPAPPARGAGGRPQCVVYKTSEPPPLAQGACLLLQECSGRGRLGAAAWPAAGGRGGGGGIGRQRPLWLLLAAAAAPGTGWRPPLQRGGGGAVGCAAPEGASPPADHAARGLLPPQGSAAAQRCRPGSSTRGCGVSPAAGAAAPAGVA